MQAALLPDPNTEICIRCGLFAGRVQIRANETSSPCAKGVSVEILVIGLCVLGALSYIVLRFVRAVRKRGCACANTSQCAACANRATSCAKMLDELKPPSSGNQP